MAASHLSVLRIDSHVLGVGALTDVTALVVTAPQEAQVDFAPRGDAGPAYVRSRYGEATVEVIFKVPTRAAKVAVLRMLDWPNRYDPRELVAWVGGDPETPATLVEGTRCVVASSVDAQAGQVVVAFTTGDLAWRALTPTVSPLLTLAATSGAVAMRNPGHTTVQPEIEIGWTAQRAAGVHSPTEGWRYKRRVGPITNLTDRTWEREAWCVDLGDTAAAVTAGKMQADGDDIRVWHEGRELPRTLVNMNSARTLLWFHATTPAGDALEVDVVYGNPSATAAATVSKRDGSDADQYVAYDLEGYANTATSGTATSLTTTAAGHEVGRWARGYIQIVAGTGVGQRRQILSNTAATINVTRAWTTALDATSVYVVWMSGVAVDGGQASAGTTTTLTDAAASFGTAGQLKGARLTISAGSQAGQTRTVTSHTNTVLTFSAMPGAITATSVYRLERYGAHSYVVNAAVTETAHRGGWRLNRYYSQPGMVWFGDRAPGGWQPIRYLDNDDDVSQASFIQLGAGGGHARNYWPILDAWRKVRQDAALPEEGQADGVALYDPRGFQAILFDYQIVNENGIGRFTFAAIPPGGQNWEDLVTNTATYGPAFATIADQWVALNDTGEPFVRLYMGMLPNDGIVIPSTVSVGDDARVRWNGVLQVHLAHDGIGGLVNGIITAGTEVEVYDPAHVLRAGGGHDAIPPYVEARIARVPLASGQTLRLNLDTEAHDPLCAIVNASGVVVAETPWAVTVERVDRESWQGVSGDVRTVARDLLPAVAGDGAANRIPNPSFATDTASWTPVAGTAGVTVAWDRDAAVFYDEAGSMKGVISVAPATSWETYVDSGFFPVTEGEVVDVACAVRKTTTGITNIAAAVAYYTAAGVLVTEPGVLIATPAAGVWYPGAFGGRAPTGLAITQAKLHLTIFGAASATGTVYVDAFVDGLTVLHVAEAAPGTTTVAVSTLPRYVD